MARGQFNTVCACGSEITFIIKKPTRLQFTTAKVKCKGCESIYLVKAEVDREKPGRAFNITPDIVELSPKTRALIEQRIRVREGL